MTLENNIIDWGPSQKPFSVLKIDIHSNDGSKYLPQYIQIIEDEIPEVKGHFHLKHYKYGVILEFKSENFINKVPYFTYEEGGYRKSINMHRVNKNSFETPLINIKNFNDYKNIELHFNTDPKYIFKYQIDNLLIKPEEDFKFLYNGGQTILRGNKYTFKDTTLIWIETDFQLEDNTSTIIKPIFIGPTRLNFNKFIELTFKVPKREDLDYSSIYKYNEKNNKWTYIPSTIDKKELALIANIDSGGIYSVIKEKKSPVISNIYPGNNASYYQNDFRQIKFDILDDESGVKDETNIKLQIDDGKPLIFEYNTYRKQVVYKLDEKMTIGKHNMKIEVYDNVGNMTFKNHEFYIKN